MQKPLFPALLLGLLLAGPSAAQQNSGASAPKSDDRAQIASAERGMNQLAKDWIDAISKIAGVLGLFVAIFVAGNTAKKYRAEREAQRKKEMDQKEKELNETQLNSKRLNALFWLELRKMFAQHNEVHLKLRGEDGENWSPSNSAPLDKESEEWAKLEAYMGLLEHLKRMRSNDLIDSETLESIYGYRVANIVANPEIVREKLIKIFTGWKDFIELIRELGYQDLMIRTASAWLSSKEGDEWLTEDDDGKAWLATDEGKLWLATDDGKLWSTSGAPEE